MFAGRIPHSAIRIPHSVAEVAKLADAPDLGSGVERRASSSLALGTKTVVSGRWSVVSKKGNDHLRFWWSEVI